MKSPRVLLSAFLAVAACAVATVRAQEVRRTYAIRVADKIVGWQIETETPRREGDRAVVEFTVKSLAKIELLGSAIDQRIDQAWILDATSRAALRASSKVDAGSVVVAVSGELGEHGFAFAADGKASERKVLDPARVVIAPDFRWLLQRGPREMGRTVELEWFTPEFANVSKARVALAVADAEVAVLGQNERATTWSIEMPEVGMTFTVSVTADGRTVRYEVPAMSLVAEPAPPALVERIQRADLTSTLVGKTNLDLGDPTPLTYMKVRVVAGSTPDVTVAGLAVRGQTFTGTVVDGKVDGVFEIRPVRSDGRGAPPFPVPAGTFAAAELQPFLRPGPHIESDDPAIVQKAKELAAGATDCFQVLQRLASWAHEHIAYAIPGGGTAQRTLELGEGDCGGHSHLLAAMLRSLGIPARTPMGAMYVPLYGGSFGQHMWNEVWLGEQIGWLPVDCTAGQATFVDASHIRLHGAMTAFRPQLLEVLDYEPRSAAGPANAAARRSDAWPWAVGETWTWNWRQGGKELGVETMTYEGAGEGGHVFVSKIDLAGGRFREALRTVVGGDGGVRSFRAEREAGGKKTTFGVQVDGNKAVVTQQDGDDERRAEVDVEAGVFMLHNNSIALCGLIAARLGELADGAEAKIKIVHAEARSVMPVQVRGGKAAALAIGGVDTPVRAVTLTIAGIAMLIHVDERGRLVRYFQERGDIVVERKP
ncbi:MAG: transglutaminase-like domain-containing protein [Planctomycetota bacterium]